MIESVSRRAFSGSSGTYNVHALELAAARVRKLKGLNIIVHFLDDTEHEFHVDKRAKGNVLLEQVYQHLELVEKDYFGLQFSLNNTCTTTSNGRTTPDFIKPEFMRWIDPSKQIKKQFMNNWNGGRLYFRVKFYVSDPSKLQEEYTRYQFYLQIRRDILDGRLHLPLSTAILLASYTVQSELGDYQPDEHGPNYLSNLQLIRDQNEEMEKKISELHKLHKGQLPADAEFNFLDHAKRIEMYGVELHKAKDNTNKEIQLGVTHIGLVVFQNNIRINMFSWSKIMKISFKRKQFFIQLRREQSESYDTLLGFNMETYRSSKTLWKACVEHHTFFRLHSPRVKRKFLFKLGSKFTYSGRTEFQTVTDVKQRGKLERKFVRSPSKQLIRISQSPPPLLEDKGKVLIAPARPPRPYDNKVTSSTSKEPRKAWIEDTQPSDDDGGFLERTLEGPFSPGIAGRVLNYADEEAASSSAASSPATTIATSNGVTINNGGVYETPPYSLNNSPLTLEVDLVTITLYPDSDGKYGFNIKGGLTKDKPILISRIAPNTPADQCIPRLNVGDQIIQINNYNIINNYLHNEVVKLIQDIRLINNGKLMLIVKPNVLYGGLDDGGGGGVEGEYEEEPPYQYVPVIIDNEENHNNILLTLNNRNELDQSMLLLIDSLASGALITQYELLYRKHPDLTCDISLEQKNINKNRYRDISPYDSTRVILKDGVNGDYINANYVNMLINGTNQLNKYIATQGPLQTTTEDFWQMIIEEKCNLIIMLTTLIERGRTKCYKYWPNLNECLTMENFIIKCNNEETDICGSFIYRDFILIDLKTNEERTIKHMQYIAWPDHGVPDSPILFLNFTEKIREMRINCLDIPIVVHCSAGIGRTGVLVLMETAMCLIDTNEPVYPLEIVRNMRQQRAMMIQNASQYRFVCECVHAAYLEKKKQKLTATTTPAATITTVTITSTSSSSSFQT